MPHSISVNHWLSDDLEIGEFYIVNAFGYFVESSLDAVFAHFGRNDNSAFDQKRNTDNTAVIR